MGSGEQNDAKWAVSSFQDMVTEEPGTSSDWLDVLHRQEVLHNQDLAGWRAAVETAAKLLQQTEGSMLKLSQVSCKLPCQAYTIVLFRVLTENPTEGCYKIYLSMKRILMAR